VTAAFSAGLAAVAGAANDASVSLWTRAAAITEKRCAAPGDVYPKFLDPGYSVTNADVANNAMRCVLRLRGADRGYVLLYALKAFATINYGRDALGLHRENNVRQERLIEEMLKTTALPGALRRALKDAEQDLLNYDALSD
jgi:hypothetical protein